MYTLLFLIFSARSEIATPYGNSVSILKNYQVVFPSGYIGLHYHQKIWGFWFLHILTNTGVSHVLNLEIEFDFFIY